MHTSRETGWPEFSVNEGVGAFLLGEPDLSIPRSSGCVWKEAFNCGCACCTVWPPGCWWGLV